MYIGLTVLGGILAFIVVTSVKYQARYDIDMYAMPAALSGLSDGLTTLMTVTLAMDGKKKQYNRKSSWE